MAVLPILSYPDPRLCKVAAPVDAVDDAVRQHAHDMLDTLAHTDHAGALAATQLGIPWRMVAFNDVVQLPFGEPGQPKIGINPEIISHHGEVWSSEGCLSFPGITVRIKRYGDLTVRIQDLTMAVHTFSLNAGTYESRNFQHELDHLNGVTFFDHLSPSKRRLVESKYLKNHQKKLMR